MLRTIDRYLLRELLAALGGATAVLLLVTIGAALSEVLDKIARGKIPAALLISQIGLRAVGGLTLLLPLAAFLAVLMAYGRLYRDSEMSVLSAAGLPARALLRPLTLVAAPLTALLAALSLWLAPAALRLSDDMIESANRSLLVAGLESGSFVQLPGRPGVIYVAEVDPSGSRFKDIFLYLERKDRFDIVTAKTGELYQDHDGKERYLRLDQGYRIEGQIGQKDYKTMRFKRNDVRLPDAEGDSGGREESRTVWTDLIGSEKPGDRAELAWRVGIPLSAAILLVLAFPLARSRPREPRYGRALLAFAGYVAYVDLLALSRAWVAAGSLSPKVGLWWVHGLVLVVAALLIWRGDRIDAPKATGAPP
jgi:lipopolysaccharide export system permease protein